MTQNKQSYRLIKHICKEPNKYGEQDDYFIIEKKFLWMWIAIFRFEWHEWKQAEEKVINLNKKSK